jgi:hypothetical protein
MQPYISQTKELARMVFWGSVAFVAGQALRRRRTLRRIMRYAPLTAGAAAAYLVGCFVGAALMMVLP